MPKLVHTAPKRRLHTATGQAVVTLNGRDIYLGKYKSAESRKEYHRLIGQWEEAGGVLPKATPGGVSMFELLNAFWKHANAYYVNPDGSPSQEQVNFGTLIRRLRKSYGSTPVKDFGPLKLAAFRQLLIADELSRTNINR